MNRCRGVLVHKDVGVVSGDIPCPAAESGKQHHVFAAMFTNVGARKGMAVSCQAATAAGLKPSLRLLGRTVKCACGALSYQESVTLHDLVSERVTLTFKSVPRMDATHGCAMHTGLTCAMTAAGR